MNCIRVTAKIGRFKAVVLAGISAPCWMAAAQAEPLPLPYRAEPPYVPLIDVFGGPRKGLILSAQEAVSGRPVPITIGNTTFIPEVRRGGQTYGGYTRVNGDLQIVNGDLYLGHQAVGQSLEQLRSDYSQQQVQLQEQGGRIQVLRADTDRNTEATAVLGTSVNRLDQGLEQVRTEQSNQQVQLQEQGGSIRSLAADMVRNEQTMATMGATVNQLSEASVNHATVLQQHSATLQQHAVAINDLATEVDQSKQAIATLDQNLNRLGFGVSGATALAAALGSLPVESHESPVACGVGTGGYSSRYALAMGCAIRLSSVFSLNGGGSYLFGGSTDYGNGSLSNVAGRIGLVYRFGSSSGSSSSGATATRQVNQQLQEQLRQAEQRQQEMAADLRDLQRRLAQLESVALLR